MHKTMTALGGLAVGAAVCCTLPAPGPAQADGPGGREWRPAADAAKASEGRLRLQLFAVTSTAARGFQPLKAHLDEHLAYLAGLERDGRLFLAGPLMDPDPDRWSGDGLLVYRAADYAEAKRIAEGDPLHKAGARTFVVRPWLVNDGALTLSVRLSDQKGALPPAGR